MKERAPKVFCLKDPYTRMKDPSLISFASWTHLRVRPAAPVDSVMGGVRNSSREESTDRQRCLSIQNFPNKDENLELNSHFDREPVQEAKNRWDVLKFSSTCNNPGRSVVK